MKSICIALSIILCSIFAHGEQTNYVVDRGIVSTNNIFESISLTLKNEFDKSNSDVDNYVNNEKVDKNKFSGRSYEATRSNIEAYKSLKQSAPLDISTINIVVSGLNVMQLQEVAKYDKTMVVPKRWYKFDSKTLVAVEPIMDELEYVRYYMMTDLRKVKDISKKIKKQYKRVVKNPVSEIVIMDVIPGYSALSGFPFAKVIAGMIFDGDSQLAAYKLSAKSTFVPTPFQEKSVVLIPMEHEIEKNSLVIKPSKKMLLVFDDENSNNKRIAEHKDKRMFLTCTQMVEYISKDSELMRHDEKIIIDADNNEAHQLEHHDETYSLVVTDDKFKLKSTTKSNRSLRYNLIINRRNGKLTGKNIDTGNNISGVCSK